MKNISFIYTFLCIQLIIAQSLIGQQLPTIDLERAVQTETKFYLSDIAKGIEYIPLEAKPNCKTGNRLLNVFTTNSDIFVTNGAQVYRFDQRGKFLNLIGRNGERIGEYWFMPKVAIDTLHRHVYVSSAKLRTVVYDYEGHYIRTLRMKEDLRDNLYYISETNKLAYIGTAYEHVDKNHFFFKTTDTMNHVRYIKKSLLSKMLSSGDYVILGFSALQNGEKLWLLDEMNDTVFVYQHDKLTPLLLFNYGKYKMPLDALLAEQTLKAMGPYFRTQILGETPKYLFFYFIQDFAPEDKNDNKASVTYCLRYDKQTRTTAVHRQQGSPFIPFINDIDGGINPRFPNNKLNQWVKLIPASDLLETLTSAYLAKANAKDPKAKESLRRLVAKLKKDDNPVLMKIILKSMSFS